MSISIRPHFPFLCLIATAKCTCPIWTFLINASQGWLLPCGVMCLGLLCDAAGIGASQINLSLVSFLVRLSSVTPSLSEFPGEQQACLLLVCIKSLLQLWWPRRAPALAQRTGVRRLALDRELLRTVFSFFLLSFPFFFFSSSCFFSSFFF